MIQEAFALKMLWLDGAADLGVANLSLQHGSVWRVYCRLD